MEKEKLCWLDSPRYYHITRKEGESGSGRRKKRRVREEEGENSKPISKKSNQGGRRMEREREDFPQGECEGRKGILGRSGTGVMVVKG